MAAQEDADVKNTDARKSNSEMTKGTDASKPNHKNQVSQEEADLRKSTDSPAHPKKLSRHSVGSDRSIETSPMHPHNPARVGNRSSAGSSPMWERKVSSEGSHGVAPSTPGRSRLRQVTRGDETPDDSPAIPKFGDWDESDPAAAEGFTHIFNKVKEEKHGGGKSPMITTENSQFYGQSNENPKGCGCFPWGRK